MTSQSSKATINMSGFEIISKITLGGSQWFSTVYSLPLGERSHESPNKRDFRNDSEKSV